MIRQKPDIPEVLCPFLERECPGGEPQALRCWRRFNCAEAAPLDFEEFLFECLIADWMFLAGNAGLPR